MAEIFSDIFFAVNTNLSGTFAVFQQVFKRDACSFRVSEKRTKFFLQDMYNLLAFLKATEGSSGLVENFQINWGQAVM